MVISEGKPVAWFFLYIRYLKKVHLVYNIVLERHALKCRLKYWAHSVTGDPHLKTFATITLLPHLFNTWKYGFTKLSKMIKTWNNIFYGKVMKYVFNRWLERGGMLGAYKWAKRKACMMLQHLLMSKQERIARDYIILKANNSKQRRQISNSVGKRLMQDG